VIWRVHHHHLLLHQQPRSQGRGSHVTTLGWLLWYDECSIIIFFFNQQLRSQGREGVTHLL
jgi:hypothetical protein